MADASLLAQQAKDFKKAGDQVRATRMFQVSKFGIYNSDCPHSSPKQKTIAPVFALNSQGQPLLPDLIYLIEHNQNLVYSFAGVDLNKVNYDPLSTNSFVIFIKGKMYLCGKAGFKQSSDNNSPKFTVTEMAEDADNMVDFKKALEI